jgi:quercetin dioxygenase-like cupin family protein
MISRKVSSQEVKDTPHKVDVREMYNHPSAQVMHIELKPGETLKPHKTPVDVAFYVLEGAPTIHIGGESVSVENDTLIESPANIIHHISNDGSQNARILVIKAPRPGTSTKIL